MHEKARLRSWALQADVIASQHCSHHNRNRLLEGLEAQLYNHKLNTRSLWHETLLELVRHAKGDTSGNITHTEVKLILRLFRDTCFYLASNLGENWLSYAEEHYDHNGQIERKSSTNPFIGWADTHFNTDDDDTDLDDIPL